MTISWAGNRAVDDYSFGVYYNTSSESESFSPSVINPNQGVGWEFHEAVDRTWPTSNKFAENGGGYAVIDVPSLNLGREANVVATYLHTSSSTELNSIGISIDGGSIGWTTTTTVQSVAVSQVYTY